MANQATSEAFVSAAGSGPMPAAMESACGRSRAWIAEFERQATPELYEKATRYATERARQVTEAGGQGDDDYIVEVVQAAFADTFIGTLTWTPSASLEQHVINAIKSRTRHDRERAMERRHLSIDIHGVSPAVREVEASLAAEHRDGIRDHEVCALAAATLQRIRAEARQDEDVLRLLSAFEAGDLTKQAVITHTGMTERQYRNARNRLAGYVAKLPREMRVARTYALTLSPGKDRT